MSEYIYRHFPDAGCYTVGRYLDDHDWSTESDYKTADGAMARCQELNGTEQPTLRDRFAGRAIAGMLATDADDETAWCTNTNIPILAERAYKIADAMLEARKTTTED